MLFSTRLPAWISKIACLWFTVAVLDSLAAKDLQPSGTDAGAVQYDAIIELNPVIAASHEVLFARYWVSRDYYRVAVAWAEPNGSRTWFPVYPPTLSLGSSGGVFRLAHQLYPNNNTNLAVPLGSRGVFDNMFGDYPAVNIRYADHEARAAQVRESDLQNWHPEKTASGAAIFRTEQSLHESGRTISSLEASGESDRIASLKIFSDNQRPLKSIDYEYAPSSPPELLRQKAFLAERPVTTGFRDGGVAVTVAGQKYEFKEFPAIHEKGGRAAVVEYASINLGTKTARLPVHIEVRSGTGNELLRSAKMMNFRPIHMTAEEVERAASEFAGFSAAELQYRNFLGKYWNKDPKAMPDGDVQAIKLLCHDLEAEPCQDSTLIGQALKRQNILFEMNRALGNVEEMARHYALYLSILGGYGLEGMLLTGGYGAIETSVLWGRTAEADVLLAHWADSVTNHVKIEAALRFASGEMDSANLWATYTLLRQYGDRSSFTTGLKFEKAALQSILLYKLKALLVLRKDLNGSLAEAQAAWTASHTSIAQIAASLDNSLVEAQTRLEELHELSPPQRALKSQLAMIAAKSSGK